MALPLLAGSVMVLSGCVAGMAASAVGMAVQGAQGQPVSNQHLKPDAEKACGAQAAQYGAVQIIDIEQRAANKIKDGGGDGERRQGTALVRVRLRDQDHRLQAAPDRGPPLSAGLAPHGPI